MKYYQELARGAAMDRAEIVSLNERCKKTAGTFAKCMKLYHASGIGRAGRGLASGEYGFIK